MFRDDTSIKHHQADQRLTIFPLAFKRKIARQAASMLVQHVTFRKQFSSFTQNSNGNALDEHELSFITDHQRRNIKEVKRTDKCHSWLSKYLTTSDTSLNRAPIFIRTPFYSNNSRFHSKQIPLSRNATNEIHPPPEAFPQPLIMVHKKRLRRDYFLSTMQNCIQPPYSPNHFYAFDQINLLKLQRKLQFHSKRKYSEDLDDDQCISSDRSYSSKKQPLPSARADQQSLKKASPSAIDLSTSEPSQQILSRLEKILNLCGELRSLAKDVESHLNEQSTTQTAPPETTNEKHPPAKSQSEQTMFDIYKELETSEILTEINDESSPAEYQQTTDISSVHSHPLMQTESFKTKSPDSTTSHTTLRTPEDICSCFVKSFVEKQNCQLSSEEQDYLNELTKAYVLGREQTLREQHETTETPVDQSEKEERIDNPSSFVFDTQNNNQSNTPISPSSIIVYDNLQKSDEHSPSTQPIPANQSTISFTSNAQPQSANVNDSVSIKHQLFLDEPIGTKRTNLLPGIGPKYAQQLTDCGFSTVRRLLGFYLMIKDDRQFVLWLNTKAGLSTHSAWLCTNALRAWCQSNL